jgi:hypothetical protein
MFGWSKRERAGREIKEITTWVLGQSIVQGGSNFPPYGVFETSVAVPTLDSNICHRPA